MAKLETYQCDECGMTASIATGIIGGSALNWWHLNKHRSPAILSWDFCSFLCLIAWIERKRAFEA